MRPRGSRHRGPPAARARAGAKGPPAQPHARLGRAGEASRVRVRAGRPGLETPLLAPVALLRVRAPLRPGVGTPCVQLLPARLALGSSRAHPASGLHLYQLHGLGRKSPVFL